MLINCKFLPELEDAIPNERHPSDHLPLLCRFRFQSELDRDMALARTWFQVMQYPTCCTAPPLTMEEQKSAWVIFDWNSEGTLTFTKLRRAAQFLALQMDHETTPEIFARLREAEVPCSSPASGVVDFARFSAAYETAIHSHRNEQLPDLVEAFHAFDVNGDGKITSEELYAMLRECSPIPVSEEESRVFFREMHVGEGVALTYEEFSGRIIDSSRLPGLRTACATGGLPPRKMPGLRSAAAARWLPQPATRCFSTSAPARFVQGGFAAALGQLICRRRGLASQAAPAAAAAAAEPARPLPPGCRRGCLAHAARARLLPWPALPRLSARSPVLVRAAGLGGAAVTAVTGGFLH